MAKSSGSIGMFNGQIKVGADDGKKTGGKVKASTRKGTKKD